MKTNRFAFYRFLKCLSPTVAALFATSACDGIEAQAPLEPALIVAPLEGQACGDSGTALANPFSNGIPFEISVFSPEYYTGDVDRPIAKKKAVLSPGAAIEIPKIPEGSDRDVIFYQGLGGNKGWYGRHKGLEVLRNEAAQIDIALSRFGDYSCIKPKVEIPNTVFPSTATLGDGRIFVSGGFTNTSSSDGLRLEEPSAKAFIYDPGNGEVEVLPDMDTSMARAAHASIYLPELDKVLMVGGATSLPLDESRDFPFVFDADTALDDYLLYDLQSQSYTRGPKAMSAVRVFPRILRLADGTVLITGGGAWPYDKAGAAQIVNDIFDPEARDREGDILDIPPLQSYFWRSGHSLTALEHAGNELTSALIWGGTTLVREDQSGVRIIGQPAEIFRQSGRQKEGVNGTFSKVTLYTETADTPTPPFSYFHETTRLGNNRFLVTGGVRYERGKLSAPLDDEAWLLTYRERDGLPSLSIRYLKGFGPGRVFHSSLSDNLNQATVIGGLSGLHGIDAPAMTFDLQSLSWKAENHGPFGAHTRGAFASALSQSGTLFFVGGSSDLSEAPSSSNMWLEIFTPSSLPLP